jgi:hypothetical protein
VNTSTSQLCKAKNMLAAMVKEYNKANDTSR